MKAKFKKGDRFTGKWVSEAKLEIVGPASLVGDPLKDEHKGFDAYVYPCRVESDGEIIIFWEDTLDRSYTQDPAPFVPGYYRRTDGEGHSPAYWYVDHPTPKNREYFDEKYERLAITKAE